MEGKGKEMETDAFWTKEIRGAFSSLSIFKDGHPILLLVLDVSLFGLPFIFLNSGISFSFYRSSYLAAFPLSTLFIGLVTVSFCVMYLFCTFSELSSAYLSTFFCSVFF